MPAKLPLAAGDTVGTYTLISALEPKHGHARWQVRCKCGKARTLRGSSIASATCACSRPVKPKAAPLSPALLEQLALLPEQIGMLSESLYALSEQTSQALAALKAQIDALVKAQVAVPPAVLSRLLDTLPIGTPAPKRARLTEKDVMGDLKGTARLAAAEANMVLARNLAAKEARTPDETEELRDRLRIETELLDMDPNYERQQARRLEAGDLTKRHLSG